MQQRRYEFLYDPQFVEKGNTDVDKKNRNPTKILNEIERKLILFRIRLLLVAYSLTNTIRLKKSENSELSPFK